MRTTKPISTISFNSPEYLKLKLDELTKSGILTFWAFIPHQPEDDEAGTKEHEHVYVEPSKMLQTDDLREALKEFDPANPTKPKGCLPFRSSKFDDWYLYALHDKRYLAMKGQTRKFHYEHEKIVSSDPDNLLALSRSIDMLSLSPYADMQDAIKNGISWPEYFARGYVPIPQIKGFMLAFESLGGMGTYRNQKEAHLVRMENGDMYNPNTGEIIDPDGNRKSQKKQIEEARQHKEEKQKKQKEDLNSGFMDIPDEKLPFEV